jgi:hypothetical protein
MAIKGQRAHVWEWDRRVELKLYKRANYDPVPET